jgi:ACS family pantothenate transporter-like MFS transporter
MWSLTDMDVQLYGTSCQNSGYFAIWLKAEKFSVEMRNIIPTGTSLISGFCVVLVSALFRT